MEAKPKPPLLSRLSPRQLRIAGVGLMGILFIAVLLIFPPHGGKRRQMIRSEWLGQQITIEINEAGREMADNAVYGKVIAVQLRANRRGTIAIRSLHTGKEYRFSVGWRTSYHPGRYPAIGELVKVYYLADKGLMEATQVKIDQ